MATIVELAEIAGAHLEHHKRDNGDDFVTVKDGAPAWLRPLCHEAHGDMLPEDYRYQFIADALDIIADDYDPDESIDQDTDVYTADLTRWLASNINRLAYVDDGVEEYGWPQEGGLAKALMVGQYKERREVYDLVYAALEELAEESDDEEAEEDEEPATV